MLFSALALAALARLGATIAGVPYDLSLAPGLAWMVAGLIAYSLTRDWARPG
jgi:hypothetical protein